jgi:hypothetical protein
MAQLGVISAMKKAIELKWRSGKMKENNESNGG